LSAPVLSWLFVALRSDAPREGRAFPARRGSSRRQSGREASPPAAAPRPDAGTLRPNPQSQSFSRGYGSILPTSLIYIVLSTRGCTPWRPDAVVSTTGGENKSLHRVFKGHRERTGRRPCGAAVPAPAPYRRLTRFQGASPLC
jgi:hypothetical protein